MQFNTDMTLADFERKWTQLKKEYSWALDKMYEYRDRMERELKKARRQEKEIDRLQKKVEKLKARGNK
jgi:DNA repair ATPase RecN